MKLFSVLALSLAFLAFGFAQEKKSDKDKFQGEWSLESGERDGNAMPEEFCRGFKLKIDGEKYEAKLHDGSGEDGKVKFNDKKEIEFDSPNGVRKAIYKIDGEKFILCVSEPGADAPKEIKGVDGAMKLVLVKAKK